jgi:hypothetical protein
MPLKFQLSRCMAIMFVFCTALVCSSCFSTVASKNPREEPRPRPRPVAPTDKTLVGTWELIYRVDNRGEQKLPEMKTKLELTDKGTAIFNRTDPSKQGAVETTTGVYTLQQNEITITDDDGIKTNTWPYTLAEDILVITMPEVDKKFYWRRLPKPPGT